MENLFKLLIFIFISVAVMVFILQRVGNPMPAEKQAAWSRWILPLCALLIIAQLLKYWLS